MRRPVEMPRGVNFVVGGIIYCILSAAVLVWCGKCEALSFRSALESIKINASPGEVANRTFSLTLSNQEKPTHFKVKTEDWWRSEDGKESFYRQPGLLAHSCAKWIRLNPVEAAVSPGEVLDIRITAAVPPDAKPGGYWCALTVDEIPDPLGAMQGVGMRFVASISIGVFINISPIERAARITAVQVSSECASLKIKNEGDCPLGVEGRFEFIKPGDSKPAKTVKLPSGTILPEPIDTAVFVAKLPGVDELPSGHYLVRAIIDIGLDHYIGVQKEMDIERHAPKAATPR